MNALQPYAKEPAFVNRREKGVRVIEENRELIERFWNEHFDL